MRAAHARSSPLEQIDLQNIHQQHPQAEQQRYTAEQQVNPFRFAILIAKTQAMQRHNSGYQYKKPIR